MYPIQGTVTRRKKMKKQFSTTQITILGLMAAVLLLMAYTPLGYLNVGPLAITFNMIPVAISAIVLGPAGGAFAGGIFGLTSFLQCIGIGGTSVMGSMLFSINPVFSFILSFAPRILDGFLIGCIYRGIKKKAGISLSCAVTGFCAAFLNTVFFMFTLVTLFGNTDYVQGLMGGKNVIVFICTFVGVNALCEMLSSTLITGTVGAALSKAHLIPASQMGAKTVAKGTL